MQDRQEIPLFPLDTVLFNGGCRSLLIFEPRYVDMVSRCMRDSLGFGIVLIREGREAYIGPNAKQPAIFNIGTYSRIIDFDQTEHGQLEIKIRGERKFRIHTTREEDDHLLLGDVEFLPDERAGPIGGDFEWLVDLLKDLMKHPITEEWTNNVDLGDARSVSWRLSDMLPFPQEIKQSLLQMHLPRERLTEIRRLVNKLRG